MIECVVFDCFGTILDMSGVGAEDIGNYVRHVRNNNFSPYRFPDDWWNLRPFPDAVEGIKLLQDGGFCCVALSNGSVDLLRACCVGIRWDHIVNLVEHRVYKPNVDAYRTIEKDLGFKPQQCLMVTANPTFGDIEGAGAIGMHTQTVRHGRPNTVVELAEWLMWKVEN